MASGSSDEDEELSEQGFQIRWRRRPLPQQQIRQTAAVVSLDGMAHRLGQRWPVEEFCDSKTRCRPELVGILRHSPQDVSSVRFLEQVIAGPLWGGRVPMEHPLGSDPFDLACAYRRLHLEGRFAVVSHGERACAVLQ